MTDRSFESPPPDPTTVVVEHDCKTELHDELVGALREIHETLSAAYGHADAPYEPQALHALNLATEALMGRPPHRSDDDRRLRGRGHRCRVAGPARCSGPTRSRPRLRHMAEVWREAALPYVELRLHDAHERVTLGKNGRPKRTGEMVRAVVEITSGPARLVPATSDPQRLLEIAAMFTDAAHQLAMEIAAETGVLL